MDIAVTLLPHPLSPTTPNVSPLRTSNETPSTALTMPSSVKKCVLRSRTSRTLLKRRAPPGTRRALFERRRKFHRSWPEPGLHSEYGASNSRRLEPPTQGPLAQRSPPTSSACVARPSGHGPDRVRDSD